MNTIQTKHKAHWFAHGKLSYMAAAAGPAQKLLREMKGVVLIHDQTHLPTSPSFTRLSALATIASSAGRGFQPRIRSAFALVALRILPRSGIISRIPGL